MEELLATVERLGSIRATARHYRMTERAVKKRLGASNPRLGASPRAKAGPLSLEQQHEVIARFLAETPDPVALVWSRPRLAKLARYVGMTKDELLSDVYYAVTLSARKYDPARAQFVTVVTDAVCSVVRTSTESRLKHRRANGMLRRVEQQDGSVDRRVREAQSRQEPGVAA